jgi:hypothetical protein
VANAPRDLTATVDASSRARLPGEYQESARSISTIRRTGREAMDGNGAGP